MRIQRRFVAIVGAMMIASPSLAQFGDPTPATIKEAGVAYDKIQQRMLDAQSEQQRLNTVVQVLRTASQYPADRKEQAKLGAERKLRDAETRLANSQELYQRMRTLEPLAKARNETEFLRLADAWLAEADAEMPELNTAEAAANQAYREAYQEHGASGGATIDAQQVVSLAQGRINAARQVTQLLRSSLQNINDDAMMRFRWNVQRNIDQAERECDVGAPARVEQAKLILAAYELGTASIAKQLSDAQERVQQLQQEQNDLRQQMGRAQQAADGLVAGSELSRSRIFAAAIDEDLLHHSGGQLSSGTHVAMAGYGSGGLALVMEGRMYRLGIKLAGAQDKPPFFAREIEGVPVLAAPGEYSRDPLRLYAGRFVVHASLSSSHDSEAVDADTLAQAIALCLDLEKLSEM